MCSVLTLTETMLRHQEICKKLQQASDRIDEERYDSEAKVQKADKEVLIVYILYISSYFL